MKTQTQKRKEKEKQHYSEQQLKKIEEEKIVRAMREQTTSKYGRENKSETATRADVATRTK